MSPMPATGSSRFVAAIRIVGPALAMLLSAGGVAQAAGDAPSLAGTWTLQAADNLDRDGHRMPAFGARPQGILVIDAQGRYALEIFRSNPPTRIANDQGQAMHEVFKTAQLVSAHFGRVRVDAVHHTLTFAIEMAYSPNWNATGHYAPNWNGATQVRTYELAGDELSYRVPPEQGSGTTPVSVWRRVATPG